MEKKKIISFPNQKFGDNHQSIFKNTVNAFTKILKNQLFDCFIIHGDRIETLAAASVLTFSKIKIAHIEGGEVSGTIDELIRHSVSKMSHIHLVANNEAKNRLIQLGEFKNSIFVLGSPDLDLMNEQNLIDKTATNFAETKLLSMFYEKGFDVVDRQLVQALKGGQDYSSALAGNVSAAAKIASQLGAEVIVIGTAKISSGGKFGPMFSGQADANGKIVRTDTGEILAVVPSARGKKPHISESTAGTMAANQAAEELGKNIISQLITKWSTQQSNFTKIFVVLNKADFMSYMTFESFLKAQTVSGIRNAYAKSLNDGVAEFEVEFEGKAQALAMGLAQTSPDGLTIKVTGLSGNRITAEVSQ